MARSLFNIHNPIAIVEASRKDHMVWNLTVKMERKIQLIHLFRYKKANFFNQEDDLSIDETDRHKSNTSLKVTQLQPKLVIYAVRKFNKKY